MKNRIFAFIGTLALFLSAVEAVSQNPVVPFRSPRVTFTKSTGQPLSGGCIYTYQGGTTTQQATYTDYTGGTENTNPIILDTTGSAVMWLGANSYKFVAYSAGGYHCSSGSLQWTVDQVPGDAFLNGTISGATITNPTITGGTDSGTSISSAVITGSSINSSAIGSTMPSSGSFTSVASALQAVTFNATPVFASSSYGYFTMTLSGNVTSSTITGATTGQQITFDICQNSTGQVVSGVTTGFTFAWPSNLKNAPPVNNSLSACTIVQAFYNGTNWITTYSTSTALAGLFDALPFSYMPVFDTNAYTNFSMTLTANVPSSTITGGVIGQIVTIDLCQDATGGYTFVWPTNLVYAPIITTSPSACTGIVAVNNGTNWVTVGEATSSSFPLTGNLKALTSTATPVFDAANYSAFTMTLSANVSSSTITGGTVGQLIVVSLTQGSSSIAAPATAAVGTPATTGGQLPALTLFYVKCAYIYPAGESLPSAEGSAETGTGTTNQISWACPAGTGVSSYKFYVGTATNSENFYFISSSPTWVQTQIPTSGSPAYGTPGSPLTSSTYSVVWPTNLLNAPSMSNGIGSTTSLIALFNGTDWLVVGTSIGSGGGGTSCGSYSSTAASGCTVMADGKILEWITGTPQGLYGTSGSPGNNPPYTSQTVTWPIPFPTACYAPWVVTTTTIAARTVNWWHQVQGWNSTSATVQLQTSQNDAGVGGFWYGGNVTPIVYCIGN
jgi:hypothetical protein